MEKLIFQVWNFTRKMKKTFLSTPKLEEVLRKAKGYGIEGNRLVLESNGSEICEDEVLEMYAAENKIFIVLAEYEDWVENNISSSSTMLHPSTLSSNQIRNDSEYSYDQRSIIFLNSENSLILAQRISTEPAGKIILREGQRQDLLCRAGQPFQYCRFEFPNEGKIIVLSETVNKNDNFKYYGEGLQRGQCGVTIFSVQGKHNGKVKCSGAIDNEEVSGEFDLEIALAPLSPELSVREAENRDESFNANSLLEAKCVVPNGRPAARIHWFLNEMPLTSGLDPEEVVSSMDKSRGVELLSTSQIIRRRIEPEDDGKFLICHAEHEASAPEDLKDAKYQVRVRYPPIKRTNLMVYGLTLDRTNTVNVTIRSNPGPRVQWQVDGVDIPEGRQVGRYVASEARDMGNGEWNVTLTIAGLTLEDTMKTYHLRAQNGLGLTEYDVRISSAGSPVGSGLDIGAIIGIVVAIAVLLIIIALVIFARATGRWCFGGATLNTDIGPDSEAQINPHDDFDNKEYDGQVEIIDTTQQSEEVTPPVTDKLEAQKKADIKKQSTNGQHKNAKSKSSTSETSDTESAVVKEKQNQKSKRLPTFSTLFKKRNEKLIKDSKKDGNDEDEQRLSNPNDDNKEINGDGNDNDLKEDKQLVYAELDLKPSEDKLKAQAQQQQLQQQQHQPQPLNKNSTEYAEIVYVQKPPGTKDEEQTK